MRKPRADAERNRERLIAAAKQAFAEAGTEVSLEEIARRAGVGIGTLYRRFPSREAILAAVYQHEVEQIAAAGERLLASEAPADALHEWMRLMVDYVATKRVVAPALAATGAGAPAAAAGSGGGVVETMRRLLARAAERGEIRADADAEDLMRAFVGFAYGDDREGWRERVLRLVDIMMDGLRAPARR